MSVWQDPEVLARWKAGAASREANLAGVTDALFAFAGVAPGMRALDCGCGTGDMTARLAEEVGDGGRVVAVDASEGMLAVARDTCAGRRNVEFHRADLTELDLAEIGSGAERFDVALARCVVMLVPDEVSALRRIGAVLQPGGRFACSVWTEGNPRFAIPRDVLTELGHPPADDANLVMVTRLGREELIGGALEAAGFGDVQTLRVRVDARYPGFDQVAADCLTGAAVASLLHSLEEGARREAETRIVDRLRSELGTSGRMPGEMLVAAGRTQPRV